MVGWKHYHQTTHPDDLHLHRGRGWQENHNREYEQKQDVHSLPGEEEVSECPVHPSYQSNTDLLTTISFPRYCEIIENGFLAIFFFTKQNGIKITDKKQNTR